MNNRLSTYPGRVRLEPVPGQANVYDLAMADEPTDPGTPLNKATLLTDETAASLGLPEESATVNNALARLYRRTKAQLLFSKNTAGTFTFTVPDGVAKVGLFVLGGGASGSTSSQFGSATGFGGASGELIQNILTVTPGQELTGVVGAGGLAVQVSAQGASANGNAGGSSSCAGINARGGTYRIGGQCPDLIDFTSTYTTFDGARDVAPFGCIAAIPNVDTERRVTSRNLCNIAINLFDPEDKHIYCGAGGMALASQTTTNTQAVQARAKGSAGQGASGINVQTIALAATAPGDGGGGAAIFNSTGAAYIARSGAGAPGLVMIYALEG